MGAFRARLNTGFFFFFFFHKLRVHRIRTGHCYPSTELFLCTLGNDVSAEIAALSISVARAFFAFPSRLGFEALQLLRRKKKKNPFKISASILSSSFAESRLLTLLEPNQKAPRPRRVGCLTGRQAGAFHAILRRSEPESYFCCLASSVSDY